MPGEAPYELLHQKAGDFVRLAAQLNFTQGAIEMLDRCPIEDINKIVGRPALHWAVLGGDCELVAKLLDKGADPSIHTSLPEKKNTLAELLVNEKELASIVVEHAKDINAHSNDENSTMLQDAINCGNTDLANLLIAKGARKDQE